MNSLSSESLDVRSFLIALVSDVAEDKNYKKCFISNHKEVQLFFYGLKTNPRYKLFVQDLLFDTNGNYPHCDEIDELLQEFQLSGIISRPNPTYKFNDIDITKNPSGEKFKNSLSVDRKVQYDEILSSFRQNLGVLNK